MKHDFLEKFENPPSEYRGAPFWAWNCKLDKETILKQIDYFEEMGIGGFTMHCRTGLDTPYLGDEFMELVKVCVDRAKEKNMKAYLYDEDRWPSGACGGEVTKEERFRSRYLVFTPIKQEDRANADTNFYISAAVNSHGNGTLLARYDITLTDGYLTKYRRLEDNENGENVWYAYLEISEPSPWYNNQTYVNTLDKKAIQRFIETTYDKYYNCVGEEFGKTIPSIFTDEPQMVCKSTLGKANDKSEIIIPYTDSLDVDFCAHYGISLLDSLPEIFWELPNGKVSTIRYRYHDFVTEVFASAFCDTVGSWCNNHNIKLTGHMMEEVDLKSQTCAVGEAMRHYRSFQQPGIDMLCDEREYSTAKQAQSVVHQMGREGVTSELYGVTNWNFDFRGHKLQGDWQAALGISHRVHHLSWMSMAGEAKRDYPASIFYQSPWYKEYTNIENYFARINTALTSGTPNVKVCVIHPIESYWLCFGPDEQTAEIRKQLETQFNQTIEWLLFGLIDFDFISEAMIPQLYNGITTNSLNIGEMQYDAIVVPSLKTIRKSTYEMLEKFASEGGKVIFMGDIPRFINAVESELPLLLADKATQIDFQKVQLLDALSLFRTVDVKTANGIRSDKYIYQLRNDDDGMWLFIANAKTIANQDIPVSSSYTVSVKGNYNAVIFDPLTGKSHKYETEHSDDFTSVTYTFYEHDSLLVYFTKSDVSSFTTENNCIDISKLELCKTLNDISEFALSEPNVLMLDQAEYSLDNQPIRPMEEVLRIDNILRTELNYPLKMDALAQPWTDDTSEHDNQHSVTLKYHFNSHIEIDNAKLALENAEITQIVLNGEKIASQPNGYYTDECIQTIELSKIKVGENELILTMPYNKKSNIEWCYILGDFGVNIIGNRAELVALPKSIGFGDLTRQTMPFYGGNITYICDIDVDSSEYALSISKFRAPLLSVKIDGKDCGKIFTSPYVVSLGNLSGKHKIEITAYGNRINTFGPIHNISEFERWCGPNAWRTQGTLFTYEYNIKPCGVLTAPILYRKK